jgi:hypothetical protein
MENVTAENVETVVDWVKRRPAGMWQYHESYQPALDAAVAQGRIIYLRLVGGVMCGGWFGGAYYTAGTLEACAKQKLYALERDRAEVVRCGYWEGDRYEYLAAMAEVVCALVDASAVP